jgi:hypothetical protein
MRPVERLLFAQLPFLGPFGLEPGYGIASYAQFHLIGHAELDGLFVDAGHHSVDPSVRNYFISGFQCAVHGGNLFLATLSRQDQQKVEDHQDQDQRQQRHQASAGLRLANQSFPSGEHQGFRPNSFCEDDDAETARLGIVPGNSSGARMSIRTTRLVMTRF